MFGNLEGVEKNALPPHKGNLHINLSPKNELADESFNNILKIYANVVDNNTENNLELEKDQRRNQFQSITFGTLGTIDTNHFEINRKRCIEDSYKRTHQNKKFRQESHDRKAPEVENLCCFDDEQVQFKMEGNVFTSRSGTSEISIFVDGRSNPENAKNFNLQKRNFEVTRRRHVLQPLESFEHSGPATSSQSVTRQA
ncbi:unnamed protein product [Caenorhabditis brenneri]